MTKIGVIYPRVSDRRQLENNSISSQIKLMEQYAAAHDITVPPQFYFIEDHTATVLDRPKLNEIRKLVRNGAIQAVLVFASDRMTREPIDGAIFRDELRRAGCELHYCATRGLVAFTAEGEYFSTVEDGGNKYWKAKLAEATVRGRWEKAEGARGRPQYIPGQGRAPFGFQKAGTVKELTLEHHAEQAPVMIRIYDELVHQRRSVIEIARRFSEERIPSPSDYGRPRKDRKRPFGQWHRNILYPLIRDEVYAGRYICRRLKTTRDAARRVHTEVRPRGEWIIVPVPALVDEDVWQAAQHILTEGQRIQPQHAASRKLLSGRLRCACGATIRIRRYYRPDGTVKKLWYGCNSWELSGGYCGAPYYDQERVDQVAWDWLLGLLLDPARAVADYEAYVADLQSMHAGDYSELNRLNTRIAEEQQAMERLINLYAYATTDAAMQAALKAQQQHGELLQDLLIQRDALAMQVPDLTPPPNLIGTVSEYHDERQTVLLSANEQERRETVDDVDLRGILYVKDGRKTLRAQWLGFEKDLPLD